MRFRHAVAAGIFACALPAFAADAVAVKVCSENDDSYPWLFKDRPGLTASLLMIAEKKLGGRIELVGLPWKRCLDEVKSGVLDGAVKISYSATRAAELGSYPMAGDKPDASKRLLIDTYSLYRMKGSSVAWDGTTLKADGPVGAQSGFSVVDLLKGLGMK